MNGTYIHVVECRKQPHNTYSVANVHILILTIWSLYPSLFTSTIDLSIGVVWSWSFWIKLWHKRLLVCQEYMPSPKCHIVMTDTVIYMYIDSCRIRARAALTAREQYPSHVGHKRLWAELFSTPGSRQAGILHVLLVRGTEGSRQNEKH